MFTIIVVLTCISGLLLIGAVLIQPGKGDMAAGFGGVGGQFGSMIGMRRAADFIVKATIGLALSVMILSVAANTIFKPSVEEGSANIFENVQTSPAAPAATPAPVQAAPAQQQPAQQQQGQTTPAQGAPPAGGGQGAK